mmetsp:Transcript_4430/g.12407  ORF Transcript_4430/g.12407 Transcript_4430/m.12407 type:complete len:80 (-) Transcript_4430:1857-2096(-)
MAGLLLSGDWSEFGERVRGVVAVDHQEEADMGVAPSWLGCLRGSPLECEVRMEPGRDGGLKGRSETEGGAESEVAVAEL